ncbi:hypothetical protein CY34DRAFT_16353 [Suillus luteus UH-Slu-Lm8-n1]|uniref:Uncharacterized protein n=1 Tax=Suillus luteus UH-Slu-Lm8-n1 TaxID=930992 RepID=A0A0D0AED1_9AGAM|nr:hypothetical protein CY34DRAFT_16353 [Suillus luteus UH-Slu-Lm8-n1]
MRVGCVRFFPDEIRLASASGDGTLKIWNVSTGNFVFDINDHQDNERPVASSPNGTKLASGPDDQTFRVWNAGTGKPQTQPLSHDEPCLISACDNGRIYFWSVPTSAQLGFPLRAHSVPVDSLAISLDGELMATASSDGTAMLWTTSTRKLFGSVLQHANFIATVAFLPNSQLVATGGGENTIFLWIISQKIINMTNALSLSFVALAPNIISHLDQVSVRSSSSSLELVSFTSTPDDGTEFALEIIGSSSTSSLTSPPIEYPDGIEPPEPVGSRNATTSPSPSVPLQSHSFPRISTDSSSTPVLDNPESFWKRFPLLNKSVVSVNSTPWHIGSII